MSTTEQIAGELLGARDWTGRIYSDGGVSQLELWTEWQWMTSREKAGSFPF